MPRAKKQYSNKKIPRAAARRLTLGELPQVLDRAEAEVEYALQKLSMAYEVLARTKKVLEEARGSRERTVNWSPGVGFYTDADHDAYQRGEGGTLQGPTE